MVFMKKQRVIIFHELHYEKAGYIFIGDSYDMLADSSHWKSHHQKVVNVSSLSLVVWNWFWLWNGYIEFIRREIIMLLVLR